MKGRPGLPKAPVDHVSLSACGWLYMFQCGVVAFMQDQFDLSHTKCYGTSAGAIVGCSLCCNYPTKRLGEEILRAHRTQREKKDFLMMVPLAEEGCDKLCPEDAHAKCSNRLTIVCSALEQSVLSLFSSKHFNSFPSRQDIVAVLKATIRVPIIGGYWPAYVRGHYLFDGLLTESHCRMDEASGRLLRIVHNDRCACGCATTPDQTIMPDIDLPKHWALLPPSEGALRVLFYHGYGQAAAFFQKCNADAGGEAGSEASPLDEEEKCWSRSCVEDLESAALDADSSRVLFQYAVTHREHVTAYLRAHVRDNMGRWESYGLHVLRYMLVFLLAILPLFSKLFGPALSYFIIID